MRNATPTPESGAHSTRAERDRRKGRRRAGAAVVLASAFAVGLGAVVVPRWLDDSAPRAHFLVDRQHSVTELHLPGGRTKSLGLVEVQQRIHATPATVGAAPKLPRQTIDAYLAAQVAHDASAQYALLTSNVRAHAPSVAEWQHTQARVAPVARFTVLAEHPGVGIANYDVELTTAPMLDPTLGLVTGRALATYVVKGESDGFRVDADATRVQQQLAPLDRIESDARAWIAARTACGPDGAGLLGARAEQLRARCAARATPASQFGPPMSAADRSDVRDLVAAYGPDSLTWARVLPVTAPEPLDLILAPFADHWVVVGAYQASGHSG